MISFRIRYVKLKEIYTHISLKLKFITITLKVKLDEIRRIARVFNSKGQHEKNLCGIFEKVPAVSVFAAQQKEFPVGFSVYMSERTA